MQSRYMNLISLTAGLALIACAHVTNKPLCDGKSCKYDSSAQTTYRFSPKADKSTLVIVTLSGGGARAAALAFGTLKMLEELDPGDAGTGQSAGSLLDQVDIISSVSGGSVTAGWYALRGKSGLSTAGDDAKLWTFLKGEWTGELIWKGLNPWTVGRYAFSSYERNDVLVDFFRQHLFKDATYDDVLNKYRSDPHQPYVILNATDLGHEAIFPFTQGHFDLLCSDLGKYRLADAVAASGNFPLAFSPLGLQNYSGCAAQQSPSWSTDGPPQWVDHYGRFEGKSSAVTPLSIQLNEVRSAREAQDFLQSPILGNGDKYLHLLDGGVTDNLGIRSTLAIEDDPARVPSLYLRLSGGQRPAGYQNIRRILYIVVNARTRDPKGIDTVKRPSGEVKTALRMTDTQLDASTLADQDYLIAELEAIANSSRDSQAVADAQCPGPAAFLSCKPGAQSTYRAPDGRLAFYVVSVDFEMIPDKACRDKAWLLPTNWGLGERKVQEVAELAKVILGNSRDLKKYYKDTNGSLPDVLKAPQSFDSVCASLIAEKN
jgi:NTE family protein